MGEEEVSNGVARHLSWRLDDMAKRLDGMETHEGHAKDMLSVDRDVTRVEADLRTEREARREDVRQLLLKIDEVSGLAGSRAFGLVVTLLVMAGGIVGVLAAALLAEIG